MPFEQSVARSLTASSVREHAPALSGVYGISEAGVWNYIGETDNIQQALLIYILEPDTGHRREHPAGFVFELCDAAARSDRQDRLVFEYEPAGNRHWTLHR